MQSKLFRLVVLTLGLLFSSLSFADANSSLLLHSSTDPVAGNPKGNITVVEFFDYQCSHCISMAPVIAAIIKNNPDVRIVFKDFPIRGPISEFAAKAALAANKQGKYYTFSHNLLTTNQFLTEETILDIAKKSGLNMAKFKQDMNSREITDQLRNTYSLASAIKVDATPAFFIGKTDSKTVGSLNFVLGEMSQPELQQAIDRLK